MKFAFIFLASLLLIAAFVDVDAKHEAAKKPKVQGKNNNKNNKNKLEQVPLEPPVDRQQKLAEMTEKFGRMNKRIFCSPAESNMCIGSGDCLSNAKMLNDQNVQTVIALDGAVKTADQLKDIVYLSVEPSDAAVTAANVAANISLICDALKSELLYNTPSTADEDSRTVVYHSWNLQRAKDIVVAQMLFGDLDLKLDDIKLSYTRLMAGGGGGIGGIGGGRKSSQWNEELKTLADGQRDIAQWKAKCTIA